MCDCCWLTCEECDKGVPVHIGDFSTARDNVAVRCWNHRPNKNDKLKWVLFRKCRGDRKYGNWFMAIREYEAVDSGYDIGEEGDIVPNCDCEAELPWTS